MRILLLISLFIGARASAEDSWLRTQWNKVAIPVNGFFWEMATGSDCEESLVYSQVDGDLARLLSRQGCSSASQAQDLATAKTNAEDVLEQALLRQIVLDLKKENQCESENLLQVQQDPRPLLKDFCGGKTSSLNPEGLPKPVRLQIEIAKETYQKSLQISQLQRWRKSLAHLEADTELPADPSTLNCESYFSGSRPWPGDARKKKCKMVAEQGILALQDSVWKSSNPLMQEYFTKEMEAFNTRTPSEGEFLLRALCGESSLYNKVIKPSAQGLESQKSELNGFSEDPNKNTRLARYVTRNNLYAPYMAQSRIKAQPLRLTTRSGTEFEGFHVAESDDEILLNPEPPIPGVAPDPKKFIRLKKDDLAPGSLDVNYQRLFSQAVCRWEKKYGSGSDMALTVVEGGIDIGMTFTTGGLSLLSKARYLSKAKTVAQVVTKANLAARTAQMGWDVISTTRQAYETVRDCSPKDGPVVFAGACQERDARKSNPKAHYEERQTSNCALNIVMTSLGLLGLKSDLSDIRQARIRPDSPSGSPAHVRPETPSARIAGVGDSAARLTVSGRVISTLGDIRTHFLKLKATTPEQNNAFVDLVERTEGKAKLYFNSENTILKEMNDKIFAGDKDLATALTNMHQSLLLEEIKKNPTLSKAILAQYTDFKHLRLALSDDSPAIREALESAVQAANSNFEGLVKSGALDSVLKGKELKGIAGDAKNWFMAGVGQTMDQSGAATRAGRNQFRKQKGNPITLRTFEQERKFLEGQALQAERYRIKIQKTVPNQRGILAKSDTGKMVLSPEAVDIFRKIPSGPRTDEQFYNLLQRQFRATFGVTLNHDQLRAMREYINHVDNFSPGLLVRGRDLPDPADAVYGVISIDRAGMGAENISAQMAQMAGDTDVSSLLVAAREAELQMTRKLNGERALARTQIDNVVPSRIGFSGDDGIALPSKPLLDAQKFEILNRLTGRIEPNKVRVTFLSPFTREGKIVPPEARAQWIGKAEDLEKRLRKAAVGFVQNSALKKMTMAIDLTPTSATNTAEEFTLAGSQVRVILAGEVKDQDFTSLSRYIRAQLKREGIDIPVGACVIYSGAGRCIDPGVLRPNGSSKSTRFPGGHATAESVTKSSIWAASKSSPETRIQNWPKRSQPKSGLISAAA